MAMHSLAKKPAFEQRVAALAPRRVLSQPKQLKGRIRRIRDDFATPSSAMERPRDAKRIRPAGLDAVVTTLDLSSLGEIFSLAVDTDGTRLVCTASALYVVSPSGRHSLLAGHKTETGFKDGQGMDARFYQPCGIVVDGEGNVLVADTQNHILRKVARGGAVSTLAGSGGRLCRWNRSSCAI